MLLLTLALGAAGCDRKGQTELPSLDATHLLPGKLLNDIGEGRLEVDPTASDPLTGLGACSDLLTYCYEPGIQELDACVQDVRRCATAEPWNEQPCCPEACVRSYQQARRSSEPFAAFARALFEGGSCYPGVKERVQ